MRAKVIGKGFQVVGVEDGKPVEVLYWLAPSAQCFTTWERPFESANFDKSGQEWMASDGLPADAVYVGTYEEPAGVSGKLVRR